MCVRFASRTWEGHSNAGHSKTTPTATTTTCKVLSVGCKVLALLWAQSRPKEESPHYRSPQTERKDTMARPKREAKHPRARGARTWGQDHGGTLAPRRGSSLSRLPELPPDTRVPDCEKTRRGGRGKVARGAAPGSHSQPGVFCSPFFWTPFIDFFCPNLSLAWRGGAASPETCSSPFPFPILNEAGRAARGRDVSVPGARGNFQKAPHRFLLEALVRSRSFLFLLIVSFSQYHG